MSSLNLALKRARPALGSILLLRLDVPPTLQESTVDEVLGRAFEFCEELEGKFSKFRENSDVSRLNQASVGREIPVSREFPELIGLAHDVWTTSGRAFAPWEGEDFPFVISAERGGNYAVKTRDCILDLSGIAKGFVVDKLAQMLVSELPEISGVLNAGGDLRFIGAYPRVAEVRLGHGTEAVRLEIDREALASSAMSEYLSNENSSTVYTLPARAGLGPEHVVSVVAATCASADALTKAGWFASSVAAEACARKFNARILIFDRTGQICQSFGTI